MIKKKLILPDPPLDPCNIIKKCMNIIETNNHKLFQQIETDNIVFCYPVTLCLEQQREPTLEFISAHLLIAKKTKKNTIKSYYSYDRKWYIEIDHTHRLFYSGLDDPIDTEKKYVRILEKFIVYNDSYTSLNVIFIDTAFSEQYNAETSTTGLPFHYENLQKRSTIRPLREYQNYSFQWAKQIIEDEIKNHLKAAKVNIQKTISEFFQFLDSLTVKFNRGLQKLLKVEAARLKSGVAAGSEPVVAEDRNLCLVWAHKKLTQLQQQGFLAFTTATSINPRSISHLYQPFEDYIMTSVYEPVMEALVNYYQPDEAEFVRKVSLMRNNPLALQPSCIPAYLRRLPLRLAAMEFQSITTDKGKTPLQKLICLKSTYIHLESIIMTLYPPTTVAPAPNFVAELYTSPQEVKKSPNSFNNNRRLSVSGSPLRTSNGRLPGSTDSDLIEFQYKQKRDTINLLLLLLISHSPPNLYAQLAFTQFHTINDEEFSSLMIYYTYFKASIEQLMSTSSKKQNFSSAGASGVNVRSLTYHTYYFGLYNDEIENYPFLLSGLEKLQPISIFCGEKHIILLTSKGRVYTYGWGNAGQLGHGDLNDSTSFLEVKLLSNIQSISGGGTHSAAITKDGKLYCWGGNTWGQIGMGSACTAVPIPKLVTFPENRQVKKVACGAAHNLAILSNGSIWSWGTGANGRLGHGSEYSIFSPKQIAEFPVNTSIVDIACGWSHSVCISSKNEVFTFGKGSDGQLGHGTYRDEFEPKRVDFNFGSILHCSAFYHTMILSTDGLFAWGWGEHGALGLGDSSNQCSPCLVDTFAHQLVSVSCGAFHTAAVTKKGNVLTWGNGGSGQLGHGDNSHQYLPFQVDYFRDHFITDVTCGFWNTIAVHVTQDRFN